MTKTEAIQRGFDDATKDRAPLFRSTRAHGIVATVDTDHPNWDRWSDDDRRAYLAGYDAGMDSVLR
jgi:hypothetical protein